MIDVGAIYQRVLKELNKARIKFPKQSIWITLAALTEEVGELNQSILQFNYQPEKNITINDIQTEAIQVIVMALRTILDTELADKEERK